MDDAIHIDKINSIKDPKKMIEALLDGIKLGYFVGDRYHKDFTDALIGRANEILAMDGDVTVPPCVVVRCGRADCNNCNPIGQCKRTEVELDANGWCSNKSKVN